MWKVVGRGDLEVDAGVAVEVRVGEPEVEVRFHVRELRAAAPAMSYGVVHFMAVVTSSSRGKRMMPSSHLQAEIRGLGHAAVAQRRRVAGPIPAALVQDLRRRWHPLD